MRVLVTGITGYVGAALAPRLADAGHEVSGFARDPSRAVTAIAAGIPVRRGDAVTGEGLREALRGVEVAYYLIHSMEPNVDGFAARDRQAAIAFRDAARAEGVRRVVYLGGLVPADRAASPHLASRLEVERLLLETTPDSVALRASIVIGARSRSFRFLVRLVERLPVLPLPAWRDFRTQPIDGRDVLAMLVAAASAEEAGGRSLDIAGPDVLTYGEMVERIADAMLVSRPPVRLGFSATGLTSYVAAAVAGETHELIGPLMAGLEGDLLPRDDGAAELLGVRLHRFDAAVERALREWEETGEELAAR
ncbi:MAG TPA: NAD(P)H-binding protein [Capillimicrobium sp.]|nr:NAD(P)H-binding protein [Capillimicrobium sp.]